MRLSHLLLSLLVCNMFFTNVLSYSDAENNDEESEEVDKTNDIDEEVDHETVNVNNNCPLNFEMKKGVCVPTAGATSGGYSPFNTANMLRLPNAGGISPYALGGTRPMCAYGSSYNNGVCVSQQAMQSCSPNLQGCIQPSNGYSCGENMVVYGGGCVSQSVATCPQGFTLRNGICYRAAQEITKCPPGTIFENGACRKDIPCPENSFAYNGACLQCPPDTIQVNDMCMKCPNGMNLRNGQCHCPPGTVREDDRCVLPSPQISYPMPPNPVAPIVLPIQTVSYVAPIREITQQMEMRQPIMVSQPQQRPQPIMMPQPQPIMMPQPQPIMMPQPQPIMMPQPQPVMVQPQPIVMPQPQPVMVQPQPVMMQPQPVMMQNAVFRVLQQPQSSCSVCP